LIRLPNPQFSVTAPLIRLIAEKSSVQCLQRQHARVQQGAGSSGPGGGAAAHSLRLVEGERWPGRRTARQGGRRRRPCCGGGGGGWQGGEQWPQAGLLLLTYCGTSLLLRALPPMPRPRPGGRLQAPLPVLLLGLQQVRLCSVFCSASLRPAARPAGRPAEIVPAGALPLQVCMNVNLTVLICTSRAPTSLSYPTPTRCISPR